MPEIRESTSRCLPHASQINNSDNDDIAWMQRTEIKLKPRGVRSLKIDIKLQNAAMQQVIHHGIAIGNKVVVFGHGEESLNFAQLKTMDTPLQKEHLDKIALKMLLDTTNLLSFDGEGDVADRLE